VKSDKQVGGEGKVEYGTGAQGDYVLIGGKWLSAIGLDEAFNTVLPYMAVYLATTE
jgi:hypothetical protein